MLCASWTTKRGCVPVGTVFHWKGLNSTCCALGAAGKNGENLGASGKPGWRHTSRLVWATSRCLCQMWSQYFSHTHGNVTLRWCFQWLACFGNSSAVLDEQKEQVSLSSLGAIPTHEWELLCCWYKVECQNKTAACPVCGKLFCWADCGAGLGHHFYGSRNALGIANSVQTCFPWVCGQG